MRAMIPALLLVTAIHCAAAETPIDVPATAGPTLEYKGVRFGATPADLMAAHPDFRCAGDKDNSEDTTCLLAARCSYLSYSSQKACEREFSERHTYAGEPTTMVMASFHQFQLLSVGIKILPRSYERIRDALATKYGAPEEAIEPITTNAGVTHENRISRWGTPDGTIRLRRMASRVDEGMVSLMSARYLALIQERKKGKAKAAPGDL